SAYGARRIRIWPTATAPGWVTAGSPASPNVPRSFAKTAASGTPDRAVLAKLRSRARPTAQFWRNCGLGPARPRSFGETAQRFRTAHRDGRLPRCRRLTSPLLLGKEARRV